MNSIKQILNSELDFLSNRIPYIDRNQTDGKNNYFCIYRCYFKNEGIRIYKVEPEQISILNFEKDKISKKEVGNINKIKPIVALDNQNGNLYFISKENESNSNNNNYCICFLEQNSELKYYHINEKKLKNCWTKLLVHDGNIFIVQPKKIINHDSVVKETKEKIINATCNSKYLVCMTNDKKFQFYDIQNIDFAFELCIEITLIDSAYLFLYLSNDIFYIYLSNDKSLFENKYKSREKKFEKKTITPKYNLNAYQDINQNFIEKYKEKQNTSESTINYQEMLSFVSEIAFPDNSYADDILFFGPSIYLPIKKDANSLYSKLNKIKNETFAKSSKFSQKLADFSENGDIKKLIYNVKKILKDSEENDFSCNNDEINYFLEVIELPEDIKEESIIPSSLMPGFFNFIIAEIFNTFLNLLIIKGLEKKTKECLDKEIQVYSSLYRIISSDLVKYHASKDAEKEDDDNDDDNKEKEFIQSNLYILNTSFSPISLREQLCFLYKGKTTFSKLSKEDILKYNKICPDPIVEQRVLNVAKAYLETNDFDNCIEYLKKVDTKDESLPSIQNTYINHLLNLIPNDFEKQFELLRTFHKRLPKNMYKKIYIISLKSNRFSEAVEEFCSRDAIARLVDDSSIEGSDLKQYESTIYRVLKEKNIIETIVSKLK